MIKALNMFRLLVCICAISCPMRAVAVEANTIWVMWERTNGQALACQQDDCGSQSTFQSHFLMNLPTDQAQILFEDWAPLAALKGSANVTHDRLPICGFSEADPTEITSVKEADRGMVDRLETLRGLTGIYADFRGARGPAWYRGEFGETADQMMRVAMQQAGVPLLTKEELANTPGRPQLSLRFSAEVPGCRPWSISLSLKQTVVLTRDLTMMFDTTTWSASERQSEEDVDFGPENAIQSVLTTFAQSFLKANANADLVEATSNAQ